MHCPAAVGAELKPALVRAASPTEVCKWLIASASWITECSSLYKPLMTVNYIFTATTAAFLGGKQKCYFGH